VVVLWIFALPIYDLFSSMMRRVMQGYSPFHGDSEHLHHVLRRSGLSSCRVALTVLGASVLLGAVGFAARWAGVAEGWLFTAWLALGAAYHTVFGSGLVIARRAEAHEETRENRELIAGRYGTIGKHR
jgi:UDP-GlcNAc:undecaprenyl-phosphate GlcNAc-1-phosphate transferase